MNVLERAAHSKELLENTIFKEAFSAIRSDLISKLETVGFQDIDAQHELTLMLQLLKRVKSQLERWVDDGKVESKKIEASNWRERVVQRWRG